MPRSTLKEWTLDPGVALIGKLVALVNKRVADSLHQLALNGGNIDELMSRHCFIN